ANLIATIGSRGVVTATQGVVWAAFFNFVAAFGFGVQVAKTVGKGVVETSIVDHWVILSGLLGAITWNLITWYFGIPSSSSHALIGGYARAGLCQDGVGAVRLSGLGKNPAVLRPGPPLGTPLSLALFGW